MACTISKLKTVKLYVVEEQEIYRELYKSVLSFGSLETPFDLLGVSTNGDTGALKQAISELANQGVKTITVAPVFISARGHVLKDVPSEAARAKERFPGLEIELSPALGELPEVQKAMTQSLVAMAGGPKKPKG